MPLPKGKAGFVHRVSCSTQPANSPNFAIALAVFPPQTMRVNLRVRQKGLLLVAVPLAFEVIFVALLTFFLWQSESVTTREQHSKAIVIQLETIVKHIWEGAQYFAIYGLTHSETALKKFDQSIVDMEQQLKSLKSMVKDDGEQLQNAIKVEKDIQSIYEVTRTFQRGVEEGERINPVQGVFLRREMMQRMDSLVKDSTEMGRIERERRKHYPLDEESAKMLVKIALGAGLLMNIGICIFLAIYFSKDITHRLSTIVENTVKLAEGKKLHPVLTGSDEIAQLDWVFHKMALQLEQAARKERAIIDNAQDVICSLNREGLFSQLSPAASRMWGYGIDELLGKSIGRLIPEEELPKVTRILEEAKASPTAVSLDTQIKCKNGTSVWMLWSVYWSEPEEGFFCVAHDINERKMLDQMKQDFVNMVSHDLRTPLTGMRAFLDSLSVGVYGKLNDKGQASVTKLQSSLVRLVNLVNELLDIEKMEAGKMSMHMESARLNQLLEAACDMVRNYAEQQRVTLIMEEGPADIRVSVDGTRMIQVVQNLLSNAIKFSPEGGAVALSWSVDDGAVTVRVKDDGCGIAEANKGAVFDRFRQVHDDTGGNRGGTGLGLAICKAIVEQHNGAIGVESQEGKGSTFWFRLPVEQRQLETA